MSIKDYRKCLSINNTLTGQCIDTIDFADDSILDNYKDIYIKLPFSDLRILSAIHECIDNDINCHLNIGYKNFP